MDSEALNMCGLFAHWGSVPIPVGPVHEVLRRRGPDGQGYWHELVGGGYLQLIHSRLAIQDLTSAGHQPMRSREGRFTLVFNGEIYNAPELRENLKKSGFDFQSCSDTEVILAGYAHWGPELFSRLNGIFAVTIWDSQLQTVTLARDPFGVKPLLWLCEPTRWAVGSELSIFRAAGLPSQARLDPVALEQFWQWGAVQSPRTLVQGVEQLPPGHWAQWRLQDRPDQWQICPFYEFPSQLLTSEDLSLDDAISAVATSFERAVDRQMLADVPVGAFLSGGLDSASIVALMAERKGIPIQTFSLGFDESDQCFGVVDERSVAASLAHYFKTDHHEVVLSAAEVVESLDEFCEAIDQPSVDGLNTFLVSRAARAQGLKVAMSGLGGDELFGGYPVFQNAWRYQKDPSLVSPFLSRLPWKVLQRMGWEYHAFARGVPYALAQQRQLNRGDQCFKSLYSVCEDELDVASQVSRLELRGYMLNTLLRDSDAVTMHHGLELRVPFLDLELSNLLLSLPAPYKLNLSTVKPLLQHAMAPRLPDSVLKMEKRGFELPFSSWLKQINPSPLEPEALGQLWAKRVNRAHALYQRRPHRYHGWWQWHILARWLVQWPDLILDSADV
jgi:asparagine synthase (glutamine-hydrolysing)